MTRRTGVSAIRFEATLHTIGKWTILRLPEKASEQLPSRGQVAVLGTINGHEFQTVLEPDGCSGHWMRIDEKLQRTAAISAGDTATLEIEPTTDWPEPDVPQDFETALVALDFRGLGGEIFGVFPGQADGMDFCGFWLVSINSLKSGGDDDTAELGGHVGGGRLGLGGVPGGVQPAGLGISGVMARGGVPADGDGLAGEHERDGALDGCRGAVAGLSAAEQLLRVFYRDFNCPSRGVPFDHPGDVRVLLRGDERKVISGFLLVADEDDGDGGRAGDGVPQAGEGVHGGGLGLAIAGDRDLREHGTRGDLRERLQPLS